MTKEKEMVIYGISRSLYLLLIFIVSFVGMAFIFVVTATNNILLGIFGAVLALTLVGINYGLMRYHTEIMILYTSANFGHIIENMCDIEFFEEEESKLEETDE